MQTISPDKHRVKRETSSLDTRSGYPKRRKIPITATLLTSALVIGFLFRVLFAQSIMPPPARMQGETTQSYRYARIISDGGSIPARDTLVMHPQGMITSENSIFEEYLAGYIHRITGGDFDVFIRFFCILFPLLTVPALYFWMRGTGFDLRSALLGSSLYAFIFPALLRTRGESFYRETVALPLIVLLGCLTDISLSRTERKAAGFPYVEICAGITLFLALAAWKVTSFLTTFLFLYLLWRESSKCKGNYTLRSILAAAALAASLLLPHLRHDAFWLSPSVILAVFLLIPSLKSRWLPWLATGLATFSLLLGSGSTGHVGAVVLSKIRFLFRHPSDPSLISPDARLFWVSGYTSPTPAQFLLLFGIPLAAAIPGIKGFVSRRKCTLLIWFVPLSLAGYLFFDRLHVFLAVAIIPIIAETARKLKIFIPVAALIIAQSLFPGDLASLISDSGLRFRDSASLMGECEADDMISWIDRNTEENEAFMSFWHISGLVSAYADRPVATHTFFESTRNRETIIGFAGAVFQPEGSLLAFMKEHDCDLIVYQADFLLDRGYTGLLYLAGLQNIPEDAVALRMQYGHETLDSLILVFQGPSIRIFRRNSGEPVFSRSFLFDERYSHLYSDYDEARMILSDPRSASGYFADEGIMNTDPDMLSAGLLLGVSSGGPQEVTHNMLNDLIGMYISGCYSLDSVAEDIRTFMYWCGEMPQLRLLLARLYVSELRYDEAVIEYEAVLREDPGNESAGIELETILNGKL